MINAFVGPIRMFYILQIRYWTQMLTDIFGSYVTFLMIFLGTELSGIEIKTGNTLSYLIVGYWVAKFVTNAFNSIGTYLSNEMAMGTLEQMYLTPFPFLYIMFSRALASLLYSFVLNILVLILMMLTTGKWLHVDVLSIAPLVLIALVQAYSFSICMAGLTLIFRRVTAFGQVVSMMLVTFLAAPQNISPIVRYLPLNQTWHLVSRVMVTGVSLWSAPISSLFFIVIQTIILVWISLIIYRVCDQIVRRRGLLGQH